MQRETVSVLVENLEKQQRALKVSEVADLFQVSPMTIYRAAKEGSLPSFKVGSSPGFDPKAANGRLKRPTRALVISNWRAAFEEVFLISPENMNPRTMAIAPDRTSSREMGFQVRRSILE